MSWYEKIKGYYEQGLWNKRRVMDAVGKVITWEESERILEDSP